MENEQYDEPMLNDHPRRPYSAWQGNTSGLYSFRDSRQAFGHRFTVEKRSNDWLSAVAGLAVFIVSVLAFAARMS